MADLSGLAPYADDPDVVAYLQSLYQSQQQPQAAQPSQPFDAGLTSAYGTADTNYGNTLAAIGAQEPAIQRGFGYDDQGNVDPTNPFGRAQLLQRSYQQSLKGTNNSMAGRGQLYSGANQRAQDDAQFNYQANDSALRNQYGQQIAGLAAQRAVASNTRNDAKQGAYWDWVNAQIAQRAANPAGAPAPDAGIPQDPSAGYGAAPAPQDPYGGDLGGLVGGGSAGYGLGAAVGAPTGSSLGGQVGTPQGGGLGQYAGNAQVVAYLKAMQAKALGSGVGGRIG